MLMQRRQNWRSWGCCRLLPHHQLLLVPAAAISGIVSFILLGVGLRQISIMQRGIFFCTLQQTERQQPPHRSPGVGRIVLTGPLYAAAVGLDISLSRIKQDDRQLRWLAGVGIGKL